ncbi:MAG: biopolymer transporter ExbD [Gammaproteobacteria bacterium RIFCSPLOWO2_02_FULL_61_13]|nr:MAG: biopolymer transporter ExbD [Gammaproteobacteria bacterium RIFCSPLOWO2_02_FULL_61_13]
MSMNVGTGGAEEEFSEAISAINTTPLVDVMLVLLIIFLITIPVVIQTVPVDLPKVANQPTTTKPENIVIAVNRDGKMFWNERRIANTRALIEKVKEVAVLVPQPEIHVRGDRYTRFENIGKVIVAVQRGGVVKVGFITQPEPGQH